MTEWTFADVWEAIAAAQPERAANIQGERVLTWAEFDARSDALAAHLIAAGLGHQAKVAAYLYNGPEYLETYFAAFKGGYAPVNTNYRYGPEELIYLFDNADAEAVVFHASFAPTVDPAAPYQWFDVCAAISDYGLDRCSSPSWLISASGREWPQRARCRRCSPSSSWC